MAFDAKVTRFTAPTSTGTQTVDTGLGADPDGLLFMFGTIGETEDSIEDDVRCGWGICDGALSQYTVAFSWPWNVDMRQGSMKAEAARVIKLPGAGTQYVDNYDETVIAEAELVTLNGDGTIDLDWTTVTGDEWPIALLAFNGVTNCVVGEATAVDDTVNPTVTDVGFDPTGLFFISGRPNWSAGLWDEGMYVGGSLDHEAAVGSSQLGGGISQFLWRSQFSGGAARGLDSRIVGVDGLLAFQPGDFTDATPYDTWSLDFVTDGFETLKVSGDEAQGLPFAYMAFDTAVVEILFENLMPDYFDPAWPDGMRQRFCRVAPAAAISIEADENVPRSSQSAAGIVDYSAGQYAPHYSAWQTAPGGQASPCQVGSGFFNDFIAIRGDPRLEVGTPATVTRSQTMALTRLDPLDANVVAIITEDFDAGVSGIDSGSIANGAFALMIGELALPVPEILPPEIICDDEDNGLAVWFKGFLNPNQLETEFYWEWGATTAYGSQTDTYTIDDHARTNWQRVTVPHDVRVVVLDTEVTVRPAWTDTSFPGWDPGGVFETGTPWTLGQVVHYRLVATNENGTVESADRQFSVVCGAPQIWRYR